MDPVSLVSVPSSAPENVVAHGIGSSLIVVQWENITLSNQNGIILGWKILYTSGNGAEMQTLDVPDPAAHSASLTGLEKYREYNVQVAGYTRIGVGIPSAAIMERTLEDVPDRPYNVFFPDVSLDQVRMAWEPPMRPNGVILGYRISYKLDGTVDDISSSFLPANARYCIIPLRWVIQKRSEDYSEHCIFIVDTFDSTRQGAEMGHPREMVEKSAHKQCFFFQTTSTVILIDTFSDLNCFLNGFKHEKKMVLNLKRNQKTKRGRHQRIFSCLIFFQIQSLYFFPVWIQSETT